jgi:hypothetical protein
VALPVAGATPLRCARNMSYPHTVLARSKRYVVSHVFEVVFLREIGGRELVIGDFYGDPEAAIIDSQERWVVMVGCGIILYRLDGAFFPYEYGLKINQWWEDYRNPPDIWWIDSVEQWSRYHVRFHVDSHSDKAGIYELDVRTLSVIQIESETSEEAQQDAASNGG